METPRSRCVHLRATPPTVVGIHDQLLLRQRGVGWYRRKSLAERRVPWRTEKKRARHVAEGAEIDEIKKQFRARAKALHPDTSDGTASEDAFHELKAAYETLLERRGAESDPQDEVYGPGMRARLNAARAWRIELRVQRVQDCVRLTCAIMLDVVPEVHVREQWQSLRAA